MTYRFYILLLFDFKNTQNNVVNLNDVLIVLRQYLDKSICLSLKNIILYLFCNGYFHSKIT